MINVQDVAIWQHWNIEKNLISVDGEILDYTYVSPPPYSETDLTWPLITIGVVIVGAVIVLWILGIIPKKK